MRKAIFIIFLILFGQADDNLTIVYQNDYKSAQQEAKKERKYLFIVVTAKNCRWCKKLKKTTLNNKEIKDNLAKGYIAVALDRDSSYYPKFIEIMAVPSVIIVDPNSEEVIKDIIGFRKNADDYLKWFRYVDVLKEE